MKSFKHKLLGGSLFFFSATVLMYSDNSVKAAELSINTDSVPQAVTNYVQDNWEPITKAQGTIDRISVDNIYLRRSENTSI